METYRRFLKADRWDEWEELETDQRRKIPPPPPQKPYPEDATLVELIAPKDLTVGRMPLIEAINRRKSRRKFTQESLTREELSFLLWATQGVREVYSGGTVTRRTVPSGGSRHPFETYLLINRVNGLESGLTGIYRWRTNCAFCGPMLSWWERSTMHVGGRPLWARAPWSSFGRLFPIERNGDTASLVTK